MGQVIHALLTRPPLSHSTLHPEGICAEASFDLHVLSTPPAFILSQDQTLELNSSKLRLVSFVWFRSVKTLFVFLTLLFKVASQSLENVPWMNLVNWQVCVSCFKTSFNSFLLSFQGCFTILLSRFCMSGSWAATVLVYLNSFSLSTTFLTFLKLFESISEI